ncbi:hypothetical protein PVAND_016509 [Polypedilum vanderplanki]|uniref:MD-2-related lipid-recognition domain-containing protein n=1 Tax=Polypedilum vanderplanki TaxID=319348 RepID=A0A9J6BFB6_POLVA|nr:hypothetical protein PVAND_016509 [Polypedilum vanderplanki]
MKVEILFFMVFSIFVKVVEINCISYNIKKIESCETTGKSLDIEKCEANGEQISVTLFIKTLKDINVQFELFQLQDSKPRQLFKAPVIDWCKNIKQKNSNSSPLNKIILDVAKEQAPEFVRPCPWSGYYSFSNLTINRKVVMVFPAGIYRFILKAFNNEDKRLLKVSVLAEMY